MQNTKSANFRPCAALTRNTIRQNLTVRQGGQIKMCGPLAKRFKNDMRRFDLSGNELLAICLMGSKPKHEDIAVHFLDAKGVNCLFYRGEQCLLGHAGLDGEITGPFKTVSLPDSIQWFAIVDNADCGVSCFGEAFSTWLEAIRQALINAIAKAGL